MESQLDSTSLLKDIYSNTLNYGIFTIDMDGRITTWNAGAERITGFSGEEVLRQSHTLIFTPEDREKDEPGQEMRIAQTTGRAEDYRWHIRKDGSRFWADGVLTPLHDAAGKQIGYLKIFRDITDRKIAEMEVHRAANSDALTGLANRYALELRAVDLIASSLRTKQPVAVHLIDLDRFKQINDTLGHQAGDLLLKQAAQRMQGVLREGDMLARVGGDEFVLLQTTMSSLQSGADLASKLLKVLSQPFMINDHEVFISSSIGIALCPNDGQDLDQLLKKADLALYRAKQDGKGRFHYFTEKLDAEAHRKSQALSELRKAVEKKEFWVEYQPKISFTDARIVGMEALLRCANPTLAASSIEGVIDLARESGLMKHLSLWVLQEACTQMQKWKESGLKDAKMCVNLCSEDLTDPETPKFIDAILAETGLEARDLEIELTERQALEVEKHGCDTLKAIREKGIDIALDDFGTGYSALSYLRNLPVTAVKLDKSFLIGVPNHPQAAAVIKAILDLSQALGLDVVAEGVETEEQAALLKSFNCTSLQGFLVSKPLNAEAMTTWLFGGTKTVH